MVTVPIPGLYWLEFPTRYARPPDGDRRTPPVGAAVSDPLIDRFAEACGATDRSTCASIWPKPGFWPKVRSHSPSASSPRRCLRRDPDRSRSKPPHAWLQILWRPRVRRRSRQSDGLKWPDGRIGSGWMGVDTPIRVGRSSSTCERPPRAARCPFDPVPTRFIRPFRGSLRPAVNLDFRNGRRRGIAGP